MAEIDINKINESGAKKEVIEVYELLKDYLEDSVRQDWVKDVYKRGWEVAYGKSDALWSKDEKNDMTKKGQIPISINDLSKGIQGSCAIATANRPGINVKPIGNSDLYVAELIKRGFDYNWNQNRGGEIFFDICKEAKTGSLGVVEIKYDEAKGKYGKIVISSDNPLDYYFDKKSRKSDKSDSPIIKAHLVTKEYAKEHYDVTDDDLEFKPIPEDQDAGQSEEGDKSDGYVDALKLDKKPNESDEKEQVWEIEAWLIKTIKTYAVLCVNPSTGQLERMDFGKDKAEAVEAKEAIELLGWEPEIKEFKSEKRVQRIIVGKKLISNEENPLGLDSDGDPVIPKILMGHDRSYDGYFVSPTYRALEITRSRNKRRMQTIYVISKNMDAPIMRSEGTKWETDDVHGDSLIVPKDAPFAPTRLNPGTTSAELMQMEMRDEQAINEEYDMNDVMKGKTPPGVEAYKAIASLQETGAMMSNPFIGVLESTIERTAKVIYALMCKYWPRQMWERLIDNDEKTSWQPDKDKEYDEATGEVKQPDANDVEMKWERALEMICPSDPEKKTEIDLENIDIRIVAGSTQPTNRMAKAMMAMDKVKVGMYDAEAALEYDDDPNKDKVIARMRQKEKMMMQAGMMKGTK
ncbi:MAG: hypothetical protein ABFD76_15305 [Smithella sp.]